MYLLQVKSLKRYSHYSHKGTNLYAIWLEKPRNSNAQGSCFCVTVNIAVNHEYFVHFGTEQMARNWKGFRQP